MNSELPRLLGAFPDAMVIVDSKGGILQANAPAASLFGLGADQLNGTPIQELFPGLLAPFTTERSWWQDPACRCLELVGNRAGARQFRAIVAVMPIQSEHGAEAVISIRDLTEAEQTQFILERGLAILNTVISSG